MSAVQEDDEEEEIQITYHYDPMKTYRAKDLGPLLELEKKLHNTLCRLRTERCRDFRSRSLTFEEFTVTYKLEEMETRSKELTAFMFPSLAIALSSANFSEEQRRKPLTIPYEPLNFALFRHDLKIRQKAKKVVAKEGFELKHFLDERELTPPPIRREPHPKWDKGFLFQQQYGGCSERIFNRLFANQQPQRTCTEGEEREKEKEGELEEEEEEEVTEFMEEPLVTGYGVAVANYKEEIEEPTQFLEDSAERSHSPPPRHDSCENEQEDVKPDVSQLANKKIKQEPATETPPDLCERLSSPFLRYVETELKRSEERLREERLREERSRKERSPPASWTTALWMPAKTGDQRKEEWRHNPRNPYRYRTDERDRKRRWSPEHSRTREESPRRNQRHHHRHHHTKH